MVSYHNSYKQGSILAGLNLMINECSVKVVYSVCMNQGITYDENAGVLIIFPNLMISCMLKPQTSQGWHYSRILDAVLIGHFLHLIQVWYYVVLFTTF